MPDTSNPILAAREQQAVLILDGGLATSLESRGHSLKDELWSARLLVDEPAAIRQAHLDFLLAGADCITTAAYQASLSALRRRGLSDGEAAETLRLSTRLALEARNAFWADPANHPDRIRPLVAASIGPYGAALGDGSEYVGRYELDDDQLYAFHRRRWHLLAMSGADLLACETIPSRREASLLLELLRETPEAWAWLSFSCRDGRHLSDGTPLAEVARACDDAPRVAALGVNCTAPRYIASLIAEARKATKKPIVVYPNSGERYDATAKSWVDGEDGIDWGDAAAEWMRLGAAAIGGCCRVGPRGIARIRQALLT